LFKNTNARRAVTTINNLGNLLNPRDDQKPDNYDKNCVYHLKIPHMPYEIYRTNRPHRLLRGFMNNTNDYKYVNNKSKFAHQSWTKATPLAP